MLAVFPFYLGLVLAIVLLIMLAQRMQVAYPVLLVVAGALLSLIPGIPVVHIDPNLIFIIFLPPLLYEAAWAISWKELWRWRRIIGSFAFIVVLLTSMAVAFVANAFIPGFSLALGFLLGGIVSPPDAVSAGAILKFVKLPRRTRYILEGESLLNDASSLIVFRFAMVALATGQFVWTNAALSFSWMIAGGIGIGVLVSWIFLKMHKHLPTDANTDVALTVITPYIIYLAAESAHSSGVLAVVSGGLFLSTRRHDFLTSASRLRGGSVWASLTFVLNGLVFTLIGLELPEIVSGLGNVSLRAAIGYGLLVTGVLVVGRLLAAYGAVVFTMIARNFIKVEDAHNPGWKTPFVFGWTGMRGVLSLAAALSIPNTLDGHMNFPQRNLILFITFIVILLTLLIQGLTLPAIIRRFDLPDYDQKHTEQEEDHYIRRKLATQALDMLHGPYEEELRGHHALQMMERKWNDHHDTQEQTPMNSVVKHVYRNILERQRQWLLDKNDKELLLDEEIVRKHLRFLDLEEERLRFL